MTDSQAPEALPGASYLADGIVDGVDVDAVQAAALACPGVAGLGSTLPGALATYLPGRRVMGIRINPDSVEVEVRTHWGHSAAVAASAIRAAARGLVNGRRIDVTLVDIELPESEIG